MFPPLPTLAQRRNGPYNDTRTEGLGKPLPETRGDVKDEGMKLEDGLLG